jgi:hypothetical protein
LKSPDARIRAAAWTPAICMHFFWSLFAQMALTLPVSSVPDMLFFPSMTVMRESSESNMGVQNVVPDFMHMRFLEAISSVAKSAPC